MLQSGENEREILLGNKQLLVIFFLGAVLLGVAFLGGYKVGRAANEKSPESTASVAAPSAPGNTVSPNGGETHSVAAEDGNEVPVPATKARQPESGATSGRALSTEEPLGSRKHRAAVQATTQENEPGSAKVVAGDGFIPRGGQEFLQVAAVGHDAANAIAQVLRKKGFRAHTVPKPGAGNLYRVIVGPLRDAGDLSGTRDSLRKTGFRDVIVQRFQ